MIDIMQPNSSILLSKPLNDQITAPIFVPNINHVSTYKHLNIIKNNDHWIGRCPGDPPRHVNMLDPSSTLQRKLARYYPSTTTTIDSYYTLRTKQQQRECLIKEPLRVTTVTSNSILSNNETTNSRLFDVLSKHITVKSEPIRPINNSINQTANTLSSWQKYWSSTQVQRKRKETSETNSTVRSSNSNLNTIHFVAIRDSSFHTTTPDSSLSDSQEASNVDKQINSIRDKRIFSIKEDKQSFLPKVLSPRLINTQKPQEIDDDTTTIIDDNDMSTISTKVYKLPLPTTKSKTSKSMVKKSSRSKSLEKPPILPSTLIERKETISTSLPTTSTSKRKSPERTRRATSKQQQQPQQSLSTIMMTTPRSKYEISRWDKPYVGARYDPPTPPSSPSVFTSVQETDQNENKQIEYL